MRRSAGNAAEALQELGLHEDHADDALVVAEEEAAEGGEGGAEEDVAGGEEAVGGWFAMGSVMVVVG